MQNFCCLPLLTYYCDLNMHQPNEQFSGWTRMVSKCWNIKGNNKIIKQALSRDFWVFYQMSWIWNWCWHIFFLEIKFCQVPNSCRFPTDGHQGAGFVKDVNSNSGHLHLHEFWVSAKLSMVLIRSHDCSYVLISLDGC